MPIPPLAIAAGAWGWDKYGKSLTDKAAGAVKGAWDKFKWKDAAEKYRAKIKKLYGTMQIAVQVARIAVQVTHSAVQATHFGVEVP